MPTGQPNGQRVTWTDTLDKQVLLSIIKLGATTMPRMEDVAADVGGGLTGSAVQNRLKILRKQAKETKAGGSASPKSAPATPKSAAKSASGAKKRKAGKAISEEPAAFDAEDDDDEEKTPMVKKVKREVFEEYDDEERL